ncbi:MAG TPA: acetyl-CoA carboxylase biotin carboxylase subunit [Candidatus Baltobacteraceae bacterium]|jgi:3-methylcrotonyl-CoA carboxylase alpha subunit|nr:acetyl-CoA carboxylase biotin carboxylase subunit [Candidatus Baltobacteraceae bacterium]
MISRLLIANRGEIAVRVARGAREMGITPLGVYSEADAGAYHLQFMDAAECIGPAPATQSYLNVASVIAAAKTLRADAVHPGYGFLSERAEFAQAVIDAGLVFVGPRPESMAAMGSKIEAKRRVREFDVPVVPGYEGDDQTPARLRSEAAQIGFPLLIKASAGGGGRGMRVVEDLAQFDEALEAAKREALAAFGNDAVLLERYLRRPRHIEFQVLGDRFGNVLHFGERECSIQRRHQKIVEEAPSVALSEELRARMGDAAVRAAKSVDYVNAGTCEFMLDEDGGFYFLEMNTRLQVEHPVTELVYGIDLVHWQLRIAAGEALPFKQEDVRPRGWAIETRIYAEDPANHLLPSTGIVTVWDPPQGPGIRLDAGVETGSEVSVYYDPMLAKLIVWGENRAAAIARLTQALETFAIGGIRANVPLLLWIARDDAFRAGDTTTRFLEERLDESIFTRERTVPQSVLASAAAALLREGRAPWRIGSVGVPLDLQTGSARVAMEATATPQPGVWQITGAFTGEVRTDRTLNNAHVSAHGVAVFEDGGSWHFEFAAPPSTHALGSHAGAGASGRVAAPMPGKIVKVAVKEGDAVQTHDLLLVLEAMKMEHRIEAPSDGTVQAVHVREGDIVPGDAILLEVQ